MKILKSYRLDAGLMFILKNYCAKNRIRQVLFIEKAIIKHLNDADVECEYKKTIEIRERIINKQMYDEQYKFLLAQSFFEKNTMKNLYKMILNAKKPAELKEFIILIKDYCDSVFKNSEVKEKIEQIEIDLKNPTNWSRAKEELKSVVGLFDENNNKFNKKGVYLTNKIHKEND